MLVSHFQLEFNVYNIRHSKLMTQINLVLYSQPNVHQMKYTENCTMNCHSKRDRKRLVCILINLIKQVISCLKLFTFPDSSYDFYDIISYFKIHRNFTYKSIYSYHFIQRILNVDFINMISLEDEYEVYLQLRHLFSCLMEVNIKTKL